MTKRALEKLEREFESKLRLFPADGPGDHSWEGLLRERIRKEIFLGLKSSARWASEAATRWRIDPSTGEFLPDITGEADKERGSGGRLS